MFFPVVLFLDGCLTVCHFSFIVECLSHPSIGSMKNTAESLVVLCPFLPGTLSTVLTHFHEWRAIQLSIWESKKTVSSVVTSHKKTTSKSSNAVQYSTGTVLSSPADHTTLHTVIYSTFLPS